MKIINQGIINRGQPNTPRAFSTFPALTPLADGSLLATYRVGSSKDSADGTIELKRSDDGGQSWSAPETPFATTLNGPKRLAPGRLCHRYRQRPLVARRHVGGPPDLSGPTTLQRRDRGLPTHGDRLGRLPRPRAHLVRLARRACPPGCRSAQPDQPRYSSCPAVG